MELITRLLRRHFLRVQIDEAFAEAAVVVSGADALEAGDGAGGLGGGGECGDIGAVEDDLLDAVDAVG